MKDKLKIGITGASGLVGSYLCLELLEKYDCEIRGLHVSGYIPPMLENCKIEWHQGSILDIGVLQDFCKNLDVVIHTAAVVSFKKEESEEMFKVNVDGTKELVDELISTHAKLIHISSIATLGRNEGKEIDESVFWNDNLSHTDYAKSKFLAEMEVNRGISEGLEAMIFQPSIILGKTEREMGSSSLWSQIKTFPWIAPIGKNGFVDVRDVVAYVSLSILDWKSGEKIILNGANLAYKTLYENVLSHLKKDVKVRAVGPKLLLILLPVVKLIFLALGKRSEISKSAIINTSKSYTYSNKKSIDLYENLYTKIDHTISNYSQL